MSLTPRQIEEIDELDSLHFSRGSAKRRKFEEALNETNLEREFEADFFDLEEDTVLTPQSEPRVLKARLHCLFAILRNLSFLPANWAVMSGTPELLQVITCFVEKSRLIRRRMSRHANYAPPEKFYLNQDDKAKDTDTIDWLREIEPYWEKFFGSYTLLECSQILSFESSWRSELESDLADDCLVLFSNLSLEVDLMKEEAAESLIGMLLNLASTRAAQNDLQENTGTPGIMLDTYRMVLETMVRLCTREDNVDMVLATRPYKRLQRVVRLLFENVQQDYCQILKELSITLLKQLILPQSPLTQYAATIDNSVKSLILFIENQTPDSSIHTRRLACEILVSISADRLNHSSLIQFEGKLADLFSNGNAIVHHDIQTKLADCLFQLTHA